MSLRSLARKSFRPSTDASARRVLTKTLVQTVLFWSVFLGILPWAITRVETATPLPTINFPLQSLLGWILFGAAGSLGLTSGAVMSVVGHGTPVPMDCPRRLVVSGPYRHVRSPMALAGLTQGCAVGMLYGSILIQVYVLAGGLLWHFWVRPIEEADLESRFGAAFRAYRRHVRCWIPRLTPYADPTDASCHGAPSRDNLPDRQRAPDP